MKWVGGGGSIGFSYFSIQFVSLVMICIDNYYVSDSFFFSCLIFQEIWNYISKREIVQETISVLFFKKIHKK